MKTKHKIFNLIACLTLMVGATTLGTMTMNVSSVSAEEDPITFEVVQGASVRAGENGGIRFQANISKDYLEALGGTVILKSSIDKMDNEDANESLTKEWNISETYNQDYATNTYYHTITFGDVSEDMLKTAAAVDMTATMWLEVDGEEVSGSRQSVTRSMRSVANVAYDKVDESDQTELKKYLGNRKFTEETLYTDSTETELVTGATDFTNDYNYAYIGAQVVGSVENGVVTLDSEKLANITEYGKKTLTLFDASNNVYNVPLVYATKILNDVTDFSVFNLSTEKVIEGYYYLMDNVTIPNAFSHEAYWGGESGTITFKTDIGFNGVFEGNGYTVSYKYNEWGLFGNILADATIQNVKFIATRNAEESDVAKTISGALARELYGAAINNVYMYIDDTLEGKTANAGFIGYRRYNNDAYKLENVIVEYASELDLSLRGGALFDTDAARAVNNDENVYVITENKYLTKPQASPITDKYGYQGYAGNDTAPTDATTKYKNIKRYDSYQAMTTAQTTDNNDFSSFNETYWDKSSGVPVWKQKGVIITVQDYAKTVIFSVADGTLPVADIFGKEATIVRAIQGTTELTVTNNVITGLTVNDNAVTETMLTVYSDTAAYNVNIKAYTKVLTEEDDLSVFALSTDNPYFKDGVIKGSFFLADNITSTKDEMVHDAYWTDYAGSYVSGYASIGFAGYLDGNGKTLSYVCRETGLLGNILEGATIQNIQLVATRNTLTSTKSTGIIQGALASYSHGGTITNVYAKIIDNTTTRHRNLSFIGYRAKGSTTYAVLTNVIVEAQNSVNATRGGVLFDSDAGRTSTTATPAQYNENVYAISANVNMANWAAGNTTNRCYANNDSATVTTGVKYANVNRYDNGTTMASAVTKVGNWAIAADGSISWQD